jgi:catechol 2,3-dioxygenase-like lactoylglutathione lyase family enzyme
MDPRPALAIGHVSLRVSDVERAAAFYETLGLRPVMKSPGLAICELRGGTHLMLFRARGTPRKGPVRSFDFMVDDVDAFRARLAAAGLAPADLRDDARGGHRYFEVSDPDGHALTVFSSHTSGRPV